MNYELAKELKDAGFPQLGDGYALILAHETEDGEMLITRIGWEKYCVNAPAFGPAIYGPTLSELIEACGRWIDLYGAGDKWSASQFTATENKEIFTGSTPEEAVARLWLALNTK